MIINLININQSMKLFLLENVLTKTLIKMNYHIFLDMVKNIQMLANFIVRNNYRQYNLKEVAIN